MLNEKDITHEVAKQLRERSGLGQRAFWHAVGVAQSVGCRYEAGSCRIPRPVRMLIVTTYGSGEPQQPALPPRVSRAIARDLERAEKTIGEARATLVANLPTT